MKVTLPDFRGHENNTLYFIGNGFDLFHNLNTRYSDFRKWLVNNRYTDFVSAMELLFPKLQDGKYLLWKDFEKSLESANLQKAHHDFFQGTDDGWFDEDVQGRVIERINPHLNKIPYLLRQWLQSTPIDNVPRLLNLSKESLYLSFNYTLLLEDVYYIPSSHVLHIHNSIQDEKPFITGHSFLYDENGITTENINIEKSTQQIAKELNGLRKPVDSIINKNSMFFDSLKNITQVVVFGHSLSDIDSLYFTKVIHQVKDDTNGISL